jgi:hypothetical protein
LISVLIFNCLFWAEFPFSIDLSAFTATWKWFWFWLTFILFLKYYIFCIIFRVTGIYTCWCGLRVEGRKIISPLMLYIFGLIWFFLSFIYLNTFYILISLLCVFIRRLELNENFITWKIFRIFVSCCVIFFSSFVSWQNKYSNYFG